MKKETVEMLRKQYAMTWFNNSEMIDWNIRHIADIAELPSGIIPVRKQHIETRFCFGESGYDYDEAVSMANHARTSESYFRRYNMKYYDDIIQSISDSLIGGYRKLCLVNMYVSQPDCCLLREITFMKPADFKRLEFENYHVATAEEHRIILDAYMRAAKAHERKIDSYLKRYGMTKVHAWTYWRDA